MSRFEINRHHGAKPLWGQEIERPFAAADIGDVHRSIPNYRPTPLVELPGLAGRLGIGCLLVKDESTRFGLKAFKALGATYAIFRFLEEYLRSKNRLWPPATRFYATSDVLPEDELTLTTATDGNHGRGVAWAARLLRQQAIIYVPSSTVPARLEAIRGEGAEVVVVDGTYDDAVRQCAADARREGRQIISDTSWAGYETIPRSIMAGYLTLFREIESVLVPEDSIDLVIVQGGVGALAAAAAWYFCREWRRHRPRLVCVEPEQAACLLESIVSYEGEPVLSTGRQDSMMAGLNCGMPSPVAWPFIKRGFDAFVSIPDRTCTEAMQQYYRPSGDDPRIVSGESGAAGLAGLLALCRNDAARSELRLDHASTVLLLNTEGDTDPESFRRIVTM